MKRVLLTLTFAVRCLLIMSLTPALVMASSDPDQSTVSQDSILQNRDAKKTVTPAKNAHLLSARNYLLLIVSQRNAGNIAEAARQFNRQHPDLTLLARTDMQLSELTDAELSQLFSAAKGIFAAGLYGPSVVHLRNHFIQHHNNQLIINSDHRLVNLSRLRNKAVFDDLELLKKLAKSGQNITDQSRLEAIIAAHPHQREWLTLRTYWQAGDEYNHSAMIAYLFRHLLAINIPVQPPRATAAVRWYHQSSYQDGFPAVDNKPILAVIDHAGSSRPADTRILAQFCEQAAEQIEHQCLAAVANWGTAGINALQTLTDLQQRLTAVIMLQDFVIGSGNSRTIATELLQQLNVPVIKAIKSRSRQVDHYRLSADGLAQEKVYYQVAMPELQGASQPLIVAHAGAVTTDPLTGIRLQPLEADQSGIESVLTRVKNWHALQKKNNRDKRVAIVYYNHPPGRHNIGADNLDVPASLWHLLQSMKKAGYHTGDLPASQAALLDMLQQKGVNLPRDAKNLRQMSTRIQTMTVNDYQTWLARLPVSIQQEMQQGPLGLLHQQILLAIKASALTTGRELFEHTLEEMHHLLEGLDHPGRDRAETLLTQLENCYLDAFDNSRLACLEKNAPKIIDALRNTGIEGLGGWGPAPGNVMVLDEKILLPGIQFGNIFVGPQPPRGWEINEELLHANLAFPPPHQYLAFYHFLKNRFKADALVHLGRHSTYEFLPRRSVGVGADDYSRIIAGDLPGIYPYIVDGVGEGIQAKRRGLAVIVDHLTPPLKSTPLYDELLQLRQLVESFEAHHGSENHAVSERLMAQIREKIVALNLTDELAQAMSAELAVMGIGFDEVDDDLLVHEIGHYLTTLQERFMPLGLHIYGKPWSETARTMMIDSMAPESDTQRQAWSTLLTESPAAEIRGLLKGLRGEYISPGQGNDPIRSSQSLPTGRNFYALDSSLIPSRTAWALGKEMAEQARQNNSQHKDKREALVLWASDVVRDEGVMIAFGLDMLGLEPEWNSRGLVIGLKRQTLSADRVRRDTVFTTSGLFRDLYGKQMQLLNQATLMALDASSETIIKDYPALTVSLQHTLQPLQKHAQSGRETLDQNQIAAHWVQQTRELLNQGYNATEAGVIASYRVFGDAPGSYGAGINRMAERSGAWEHRKELASVYMRRLGHSYGMQDFGKPAQQAFAMQLAGVENTYFGRSSNLYGLIDNNDAFDYLGGLSLAVETLSGTEPDNFVIDHSDPQQFKTQPLTIALRQELRGRFLNPEWLQGLMTHGYAGARTMGSEFLEYLWGWQITNPTIVGDWAWQEVKAVYLDDRYELQLDSFLEQGHNVHVKTNMLAIMLVAVHKNFWQADEQTRQELAGKFAELVAVHGLPGSGHTDPDHPMLPWLEQYLSAENWQALDSVIHTAKPINTAALEVHRISEIELADQQDTQKTVEQSPPDNAKASSEQSQHEQPEPGNEQGKNWFWLMALLAVFVVIFSAFRAIQQVRQR